MLVVLAVLGASCGTGDDPTGESVTSSDGIVTVEVPAGAAPEGVTVTVDVGDPGSLPQELRDSGLPIFVYELGPDGTQFAEPVTVRFRIPAALAGFDAAAGMPMALLAGRSGDAPLDLYASVDVSLDGDVLVVSGSTDHFTDAVVIVSDVPLSLATLPSPVRVGVGQFFHAIVSNIGDYQQAVEAKGEGARTLYEAKSPISVVRLIDGIVGEFRCNDATNGVLPEAITAEVRRTFSRPDAELRENLQEPNLFQFVLFSGDIFGIFEGREVVATFHADVECTPSTTTTTTTAAPSGTGGQQSTTTESPTGSDPKGDHEDRESNKAKEGEGEAADIKSVLHVLGDSGENCFIIEVYGDGETAADAGTYLIQIEVVDPESEGGGWGADVQIRSGTPEAGFVLSGLLDSGRDRLEGAEVSVMWINGNTMKVTVAGAGTALGVESFNVLIISSSTDGNFSDHAEGVGAS